MHQPSLSKASSITQPSWRWIYQHGKSYTSWLHHTPINTRKDYHVSTFLIIRIKHNPTILTLFLLHLISRAQWSLVKIKTALRIMINIWRCDQTSRWSSWLRYLRFGVIENQSLRSTCKIVIQPSVTFVHRHNVQKPRLPITKTHDEGTLVLLSLQTLQLQLYTEAVTRLMQWYRDNLWAKGRLGAINLSVRICLHHTPINTRKDYHVSTFMIVRIKHNPTILALEL